MGTRTYDVLAVSVPIAFNAHGDHDRNGMVFTLAEHEAELAAIRNGWPRPFPDPIQHPELLPKPHPMVRPLVLRANLGDTVVLRFRNELAQPAGIHPTGVRYQVHTADGGQVGRNDNSAAGPHGGKRRYTWECDTEGVFFFHDLADLRGTERGSQAHGLFGALIVEPANASWTDPVTGAPLADGLYADVHVPGEPSFREYAVFMQDEAPNDNLVDPPHPVYECDEPRPHTHAPAAGGTRLKPSFDGPHGGEHDHHGDGATMDPASMMLMSYRAEPMGWRMLAYERMFEQGKLDPVRDTVVGEEQHHSSWLFGDPEVPIFKAYRGDRAKIRLVHAGVVETHVFHLHLHQWRAVPGNDASPIIDSISIGPQQAFTIEPIGGAGSTQRATGDIIWHCHLYPHFHGGMWGMWRVFDVLQSGAANYPDGTPIEALQPLPGHDMPPKPTRERPGFPLFIAGEYPQKSPRPPRSPGLPGGMGPRTVRTGACRVLPGPEARRDVHQGDAGRRAGAPLRARGAQRDAALLPQR